MKTTLFAIALLPVLIAGVAQTASEPSSPRLIPASMVTPIYPAQERDSKIQGTVVLAVDIGVEGTVTNLKVEKPVEGHPAFDEAAIAAVRFWRFEPARQDGKPVASTIAVPVRFALD